MEGYKYNPDRIRHVEGQNVQIDDEEKAYIMAGMENDTHDAANRYEAYLNDPEGFLEEYPLRDPLVDRYDSLRKANDAAITEEKQKVEDDKDVIFRVDFRAPEKKKPSRNASETLLRALEAHSTIKKYLADKDEYNEKYPTTLKELQELATMHARGITPEYVRRIGEHLAEIEGSVYDYRALVPQRNEKELKRDIRNSRIRMWLHMANGLLLNDESAGDYGQSPDFFNEKAKIRLNFEIKRAAKAILNGEELPDIQYTEEENEE